MSDFVTGFTAHNVRLDDGRETYPAAGWTMDRNPILLAAARVLRLIYPQGIAGRSLVDIGCLEGGFATEFARLGLHATGIEVRNSNFRNCMTVKAGTDLPHLRFVQDDAMNIGAHGPFDAVFVCGLLYHLNQPRRFLKDASRICRRVMFIDTHVAGLEEGPAERIYNLSPLVENEGLHGRWFHEFGKITETERDQLKWASFSNDRSFWITKIDLLDTLNRLGFDIVTEQFDSAGEIAAAYSPGGWRGDHNRVLITAIRSAA